MQSNRGDSPDLACVKKRKVLYLSGFDPRGAAHYHAIYRQEAEKAQSVTQRQYSVSDRKRNGRFSASWQISTETTTTDYEFLSWDDIIRQHWQKHPFQVIAKSSSAYWHFLASGTFRKVFHASKIHLTTLIYPLFFIALLLILSGLSMLLAANLISSHLPGIYIEILLFPLVGYGVFTKLGEYLESRFNYYWIMRIVRFFVALSKGEVEGINQRIDSYAEHLIKQCRDESYDEVLLIGHSVGSILLPMVLERALSTDHALLEKPGKLSIVTLGHCIPDLTLLPGTEKTREAVCRSLAAGLFWLDVTAPPDGACYPLVDIATGSRCTEATAEPRYPVAISARFHKMFAADYYKSIKFDKNRIHFQYLMSGDYHTNYNYFDITAGELTLKARYTEYQKDK